MTTKCHENSGGYALCLLYIVMCAILSVVKSFLSVNLLHMYTVYVAQVYMLKKCGALPLVIRRPVLQSAGMHI